MSEYRKLKYKYSLERDGREGKRKIIAIIIIFIIAEREKGIKNLS